MGRALWLLWTHPIKVMHWRCKALAHLRSFNFTKFSCISSDRHKMYHYEIWFTYSWALSVPALFSLQWSTSDTLLILDFKRLFQNNLLEKINTVTLAQTFLLLRIFGITFVNLYQFFSLNGLHFRQNTTYVRKFDSYKWSTYKFQLRFTSYHGTKRFHKSKNT
jgi:hypothetical protein